jgi:hypothetical protein
MTVTPGTTPPDVSLTVPEMLPATCAEAVIGPTDSATAEHTMHRQMFANVNNTNLLRAAQGYCSSTTTPIALW